MTSERFESVFRRPGRGVGLRAVTVSAILALAAAGGAGCGTTQRAQGSAEPLRSGSQPEWMSRGAAAPAGDPAIRPADLDAAFAALAAGDVTLARRVLAAGPAPRGAEARHRFLEARCDLDGGDFARAAERFLTIRRDAPDFEPAWTANNAGVALLALGRAEDATEQFAVALGRPAAERAPRMYVNAVQAHVAEGRHDEALRRADEGITMFPADAFLWDNRAWALSLLGRVPERDAAAKRASELVPAGVASATPIEVLAPVAGRVRIVQTPGGAYSHHLLRNRFAWDLQPVAADVPYSGDGTRNEDFPAFGAPVRAVAEGVVLTVRDGIEDASPGRPDARSPRGNHITIDHGGYFSYVLHLRRGSILVRPGDRVAAGAVIAAVGNSGWTTSPHVCFALTATAPPEEIAVPVRFRDAEGAEEAGAIWTVR